MASRIINKRKYDTATADKVAQSDDLNASETLYRTKNGTWFTYDDECHPPALAFTVMDAAEALAWLSRCTDGDTVQKYFPDDIKDA